MSNTQTKPAAKTEAKPVDVTNNPAWGTYVPKSGTAIHPADTVVVTDTQHQEMLSSARGSSAARRQRSIYQNGATVDAMARVMVAAGIADGKGVKLNYDRALKAVCDDLAWEANPDRRKNKRGQALRQNDTLKPRVTLYTSAAAQQAFAKANA